MQASQKQHHAESILNEQLSWKKSEFNHKGIDGAETNLELEREISKQQLLRG